MNKFWRLKRIKKQFCCYISQKDLSCETLFSFFLFKSIKRIRYKCILDMVQIQLAIFDIISDIIYIQLIIIRDVNKAGNIRRIFPRSLSGLQIYSPPSSSFSAMGQYFSPSPSPQIPQRFYRDRILKKLGYFVIFFIKKHIYFISFFKK